MRIIFAGAVKLGNYPEIYVPPGGTGLPPGAFVAVLFLGVCVEQ